jgi:hypothetical protein
LELVQGKVITLEESNFTDEQTSSYIYKNASDLVAVIRTTLKQYFADILFE